ncbi:flippase-like domain-containing protein [Bacteroidales bacterium OttesenSCG-928-I14]|nr:flippase-like domain-containing protein [Bacteroidales bacterium OttesenSCG-928-I14]
MASNFKSFILQLLKTIIPLAFGVLVLWLLFRKMDFEEIKAVMKQDVNWWIIILSLPFGLGANIMRAFRWELLIRPLGYNPKRSNLIYAVLGNYGVNLVFPRLGEVWRCTMIKQYDKVPFTKLFGTLITDRLFDLVAVFFIMVGSAIVSIPYFKQFLANNPGMFDFFENLLTSPWLYAGIICLVAVIWLVFRLFGETTIVKKVKKTLLDLWAGVVSIGKMKDKWKFTFYTILIWFGYFLYFYVCFYAFPFTESLGWQRGLFAFVMSSIAVAIPVQGSIGTWHFMIIAVLVGFGVAKSDAGAFTLVVHTIQSLIFTAAFGLFGVLALPIANRKGANVENEIVNDELNDK